MKIINFLISKMMLRQWSRRSVLSPLGRRLQQQRPGIKSSRAAAVSTITNSSWIHNSSLSNETDAKRIRLPTISSCVFSSAAEEYHPEPRPFKKLMAGKHINSAKIFGCVSLWNNIYNHLLPFAIIITQLNMLSLLPHLLYYYLSSYLHFFSQPR